MMQQVWRINDAVKSRHRRQKAGLQQLALIPGKDMHDSGDIGSLSGLCFRFGGEISTNHTP